MKTLIILASLALAPPALAQSIYKCPQPDGTLSYQHARCPDGSRERLTIKGNGAESGDTGKAAPPSRPQNRESSASSVAVQPSTRPITESNAWKGLDKIQQESTETINALNRLRR